MGHDIPSLHADCGASNRRRHPRLIARDRALIIMSGGINSLPYHLVDVGPGGAAFRYFGNTPLPLTGRIVDIYWNEELRVANLPVTVANDRSIGDEFLPKRRCGLKFGELTPSQRSQLDSFIRCCTDPDKDENQ